MNLGLMKRIFQLSKTVKKEAKVLDNLRDGALAAFLGASIVIGGYGGGLWWVLPAMAGSLALYRFLNAYINNLPFFRRANNDNFGKTLKNLEDIQSLPVPKDVKNRLTDIVLSQVSSTSSNNLVTHQKLESDDEQIVEKNIPRVTEIDGKRR